MDAGRQFPEHLRGMVEYVPMQELEGLEGNVTSPEKLGPLRESIPHEGIREPVVINYNHRTGFTFIGEGNNRLAAAREAGLTEVPAMVNRTTFTVEDRRGHGSLPGKEREPYRGADWFGAQEPPSRAGFTGRAPGS